MYVSQSLQGHLSHVQFFKTFLKLFNDVRNLISSGKSDHNWSCIKHSFHNWTGFTKTFLSSNILSPSYDHFSQH